MNQAQTEERTPAVAELFRDFETVLNAHLSEERRRRRQAERLSRTAIWLGLTALLGAAFLAYALFSGSGIGISTRAITTREVSLVDATGHVRGRWSMLPQGGTRFSLVDEHGTERLRLTLLPNGAQGITLADARGEGRVVLSLEGGEGSRLTFADEGGRPRTILGLSPEQAATLIFADMEGAPRAALGLEADGRATFALPPARNGETATDVPVDSAAEGGDD